MKKWDSYLDILKWIAIISMLFDHLGFVFFNDNEIMRTIGRLALPIFAFLIANGLRNTQNKKTYIKRIFIFALISQTPYFFLFEIHDLNVLFTFFFTMILIISIDSKNILFIIVSTLLVLFIPLNYGLYAVVLILSFYYFNDKKVLNISIYFIATIIYTIFFSSEIQIFALVSGFLIFLHPSIKEIPFLKVNKYFFYAFYPLHIFIMLIFVLANF